MRPPTVRRAAARALQARGLARAVALAALLAGCGRAEGKPEPPAAAVPRDTATLEARAVRLADLAIVPAESLAWREAWTLPARLTVDPTATQSLGAFVEGRVKAVLVRPGDRVRAGQVLVTMHSHEMNDARAALARARAMVAEAADALQLAEGQGARAERLHALRALSVADLERARSAVVQARARRAEAASELERARSYVAHLVGDGGVPAGFDDHDVLVRSPIDGTVVGRDATPGSVVLPGAPLVTVSRLGTLTLRIPLPERALPAAREGATVRFTVSAWPGRTFEGTIARVSPVVDSLTRTVEVLATVPAADGALKAEMYATAELLGSAGAPTLVVPAEAVQLFDGDTVVVAARPGGAAGTLMLEALPVRVGRRTARAVELLAPLPAGTRVVARGAAIAKAELLKRRGGE